jgi:hypothetical protein
MDVDGDESQQRYPFRQPCDRRRQWWGLLMRVVELTMKPLIQSFIRLALIPALAAVCFSQNLTGTLIGNDTGAPIPSATVQAVLLRSSLAQPPAIYSTLADSSGHFALTVPAGRYQLCVPGAAGYVDPCHWGNAQKATVPNTAGAITIQALKGASFIVRLHDPGQLLQQVGAAKGGGVSVWVSGGPGGRLPLPIVFDDGRIRDYGDLLPFNVPLVAIPASGQLNLAGVGGAALNASGISFQITSADLATTSAIGPFASVLGPRAKMIHIYTAGIQ